MRRTRPPPPRQFAAVDDSTPNLHPSKSRQIGDLGPRPHYDKLVSSLRIAAGKPDCSPFISFNPGGPPWLPIIFMEEGHGVSGSLHFS